MPQWLIYGSNDTTQRRVFVRPQDVRAVMESNDGSSILVLGNGTQIAVSTPALTVMAAISDPPEPPVMVARIDPPTNPTPMLSGAAEPFATVVVRDGGTQVVVTKADATERWEANTTPLSPGNHTLIATQTDIFGLISKPSAPCSIVIEAPAPPPAPTITGTVTSPTDTMPALSGTAKPGAWIIVLDGYTQIAVSTADGTGHWVFLITAPLTVGNHSIVATQTDTVTGLVSEPSAPYIVDIADLAPPTPPASESLPFVPPAVPPEPSETVFAPSESREPFVVTDAPATSETPVAGTPAAEDTF